jgi:protein disulfide-isomerase A6
MPRGPTLQVLDLSTDNFDDFVGGDKPAFVEFFAPWCGHCKALAPEYEVVGSTFQDSDPVVVAKVDADAHRDLAGRFGVKGYPTLKWFPAKSQTAEDYNSGRTADDIVEYINSKTGLNRRVKKEPSAVAHLSVRDFDSIVLDPEVDALVEFYAPWCGHCKALKPTYEQVARDFEGESKVVIAAVDATANQDLAARYGVQGYPTIKFFPRGADKQPQDYEMGRDEQSFLDFMNEQAGTHRVAGGGLKATAGIIAELDEFVHRFLMAHEDDRHPIVDETAAKVTELGDSVVASGEFYLKAMNRVMNKGTNWLAKESGRLGNMLKSAAVSSVRKTELMLRKNVLDAFLAKHEEIKGKDEL